MQGVLLADRFRIKGRLGVGGMGEVWSAQDERMRRVVAVKLVHALPRMNEAESKARFRREVQLAGQLCHQNIVTVHDWGEVPVRGHETLYLVMELVPGVSLQQRLKESAPSWPLAVGWAAQIALALRASHGLGVIHRDIKPGNVLLTPEGTVKVLDFGLAKFVGDTMAVHDLTATGAVLGSPPYMSPEQAEGVRKIDHRTDLYSLGCLLYHAVTGRPPFSGTSHLAVLRMHMEDTPTEPGALVENLPAALNDLMMSLLAKRPEDRPADAADVHDALSTVLVEHIVTLPGGAALPDIAQPGHGHLLAGRLLEKAWQVWLRTQTYSTSRREEADAVFEAARAKAARAANEFETNFAKRREQAERHLAARQAKAEKRLAEIEHQTEQFRVEAEQLRTDAERQAHRTVEAARRQADDIADAAAADVTAAWINTGSSAVEFELVRRGYDRRQVDEHIAQFVADRDFALSLLAKLNRLIDELQRASTDMGVDAGQARRRAADIVAEARSRGRMATTPADPLGESAVGSPFGFELVRRGYDRGQVDQHITKLMADRDHALTRIAHLARRVEEMYP
ncbi:protein kinase domain-containing protein [Streptomyces sp. NBC_01508]|uniref:serine/threonine-protein kinase n=1 Tax=Streptomyces sp. NBC_01508 TaxID=2903888 RepID=UPI00386AB392